MKLLYQNYMCLLHNQYHIPKYNDHLFLHKAYHLYSDHIVLNSLSHTNHPNILQEIK